ncbi:MAG TPA: hypothetical protein VGV86_11475 [Acidimicrobiales bacterium]|nr:hypothetical protein [Acidimicrobiales bacterium]
MAPKTSSSRSPSRTERRQAAVRRRRQDATARTTAARRAVRRKRRLKGLAASAVVVAVAGAGIGLAMRDGGGDDGPSRSLRAARVSGATGRLPIAASPAAYHAVYRAEVYKESEVTVSTEEVWVQRPFDGRVTIREGEPPGTAGQFEGRSRFGVYANYTESAAPQVAGDAPTVALGDIRVAASLDDLVDEGLFVPGNRRRALGRECQTYRTGSPLQSLKITAPTDTDYVDVCLDDAGLILEEVVIVEDELTQRLTAVSFEVEPSIDPAAFTIDGQPVAADQGGAEVTEVDRSVAPSAGYWSLDAPPPGFTHRGRYLVAGQRSSHVDVYVRGVDLVTIRQGAPVAEPDLSEFGAGREVELGVLGAGRVLLRSIGPTLIAHPGGEAFVHVGGTLAPAELQAIATGLRRS